jgi:hypothetical protein
MINKKELKELFISKDEYYIMDDDELNDNNLSVENKIFVDKSINTDITNNCGLNYICDDNIEKKCYCFSYIKKLCIVS